jgi:hypothetical protein
MLIDIEFIDSSKHLSPPTKIKDMNCALGLLLSLSIFAFAVNGSIRTNPNAEIGSFSEEEIVSTIQQLLKPLAPYPNGLFSDRVEIDEESVNPGAIPNKEDHRNLIVKPSIDPSLLLTKTTMSSTCSNKLCTYFEAALSCKAIGINLDKVYLSFIFFFVPHNFGCRHVPNIFWDESLVVQIFQLQLISTMPHLSASQSCLQLLVWSRAESRILLQG